MVEPWEQDEFIRRFKTHIRGLDERMEGGIPEGSVVVVAGTPGSMKSTVCYNILYQNVKQARLKGMYITLEQNAKDLLQHMARFGMDKKKDKDIDKNLLVVDMGQIRTQDSDENAYVDWFTTISDYLEQCHRDYKLDMCVIDSLPALYATMPNVNLRESLFHFFKKVKSLGITTIMITEVPRTNTLDYSAINTESFLSDGIIHMDARTSGSSISLYIAVAKMRKTNHDRNYFPFIVTKQGFEIVTK